MQIELVILLVTVVVVFILGYIITHPFRGSVPVTSVSDKQRAYLNSLLEESFKAEYPETNKTLDALAEIPVISLRERVGVERIKKSGKTHVANYTKYRYTGSGSRDVEIYHQPTQQWVLYYLMFSTPFEDSSLKCNGVDVTGSCNSAETSSVSRSDVFASPEYDDSTTRNNRYSDDYSSSCDTSSSYSSSDSGSSSSYSSSSD